MTIFRSKTLIFAVILAVLSVLQGSIGMFVPDQKTSAIIGMVIAAIVAILRIVTTQPLSEK
jgi:hypothetical protein